MKLFQAKTRLQYWLMLGLIVVSALAVFIGIPARAFAASICTQEYAYEPHLVNAKVLHQTGTPLLVKNDSSSAVTVGRSITITGTTNYSLSLSLTAGVSADAGIIFASVKSDFSTTVQGTISKSYSIAQTDTVNVPVPAHSSRYIAYGRWEIETSGEYVLIQTNCATVSKGSVTAYFPYADGFIIKN